MSVSFFAQVPVTGWELVCSCGEARVGDYESHAEGITALTAGVRPVCTDEYCVAYDRAYVVPQATDADGFELNMANTNASGVLDALGLLSNDGDYAGSISADDMLGRVLVALAVAPEDAGTPTFQEGNAVYCGRPAGYLQTRLAEIATLAEFAKANGYAVAWS